VCREEEVRKTTEEELTILKWYVAALVLMGLLKLAWHSRAAGSMTCAVMNTRFFCGFCCCRTENLRGNPRTQDCKEIAKYDIVSRAGAAYQSSPSMTRVMGWWA
jgi:hypothetical protein